MCITCGGCLICFNHTRVQVTLFRAHRALTSPMVEDLRTAFSVGGQVRSHVCICCVHHVHIKCISSVYQVYVMCISCPCSPVHAVCARGALEEEGVLMLMLSHTPQHPFLRLYANGKSAVRVDADAWPEGPHYFTGPPSPRWATADNVHGVWQAPVHPHVLVLHYAYSSPGDVLLRAHAMHRQCGSLLLQSVMDGAWTAALQEVVCVCA